MVINKKKKIYKKKNKKKKKINTEIEIGVNEGRRHDKKKWRKWR